jgi:hypothetical protein
MNLSEFSVKLSEGQGTLAALIALASPFVHGRASGDSNQPSKGNESKG